jgi:acyl transferase domain-containing protein
VITGGADVQEPDRVHEGTDGISWTLVVSGVALNGGRVLGPGGITSTTHLLSSSAAGETLVGEVPSMRWDVVANQVGVCVRHGGFACCIEMFDNRCFNISPAEAASMDPQQRVLLERGYGTLYASGLARSSLSGSGVGVFLGIYSNDFEEVLRASPAGPSVYAATGASVSIASGRLPFVLGLHGPNASVDTACSAALVACHSGLRALQHGECGVSLVMGVNLMLTPWLSESMGIAGMTSARGRSHTFDSRADGFARGEGCGTAALHPGGGRIATLVGSAVRQDGRSASLTAPSGPAQQALMLAALGDAGVGTTEASCIEAHGTGTPLGDPIEAGSTRGALLSDRTTHTPLAAGSVKANAGHAESAAGTAGLLRLVLLLRGACACPNAQLRALNPHVNAALGGSRCMLPTQLSTLPSERVAGGVSSFGYSGTIAHSVVRCVEAGRTASQRAESVCSFQRCVFGWRELTHPLAQQRVRSPDGSAVFRSPVSGAVRALVAEHVVQGRVFLPGAGYLEMVRAASCAAAAGLVVSAALREVFFLQPLVLQAGDATIECALAQEGRFEVLSGAHSSAGLLEPSVHCTGVRAEQATRPAAVARGVSAAEAQARCMLAADVGALYDAFVRVGLEYGPSFRMLRRVWSGGGEATAALHRRVRHSGTQVHPADLDGALQLTTVVHAGAFDETRLPFAVDSAVLDLFFADKILRAVRTIPYSLPVITDLSVTLELCVLCSRLLLNSPPYRPMLLWRAVQLV